MMKQKEQKKAMPKPTKLTQELADRAVEAEDKIDVLMATRYQGCMIYIRRMGHFFVWDSVINGEIYSGHFVFTLKEGEKYTDDFMQTAIKMCFAGAAASIDMKLGIKLDDKSKQNVKMFESVRNQIK